jgi:2-polyprenyl-3-methyl-5-hydroxy-6-metoxy-1,4-benzoquinol methylase
MTDFLPDKAYSEKLQREAELWGTDAENTAKTVAPDWRYHRHLRHNIIMHTRDIEQMLAHVRPGMTALELGCGSGWLTLAMAQRGAMARGLDVSERALNVARSYYASIKGEVSGQATYEAADLNSLQLPAETYDLVAVKGTLHHLMRMDHVISQIHHTLEPGGLLWVHDSHGEEAMSTALVASALMFLLPTYVSYGDKIRGLLRFGACAPGRIKASIEAEGLSPFEGAGREHDWLRLIETQFTVEKRIDSPAFTGYITAQVRLPDWAALPLLRGLYLADKALVHLKVLRNTGVTLYARK